MARIGRKFFALGKTKPDEPVRRRWNGLTSGIASLTQNLRPEIEQFPVEKLDFIELLFVPSYYKKLRNLPSSMENDRAFLDFLEQGAYEGFSPSPFFDSAYYCSRQKKEKNAALREQEAVWNWLVEGIDARIDPTPFFDEQHYLNSNEDVLSSQGWAFEHYIRHGIFENRSPNFWFHPNWYAKTYLKNDLKLRPAYHYALHGIVGGCYPSFGFEKTFKGTAILEKEVAFVKLQAICLLMKLSQELAPGDGYRIASLMARMSVASHLARCSESPTTLTNLAWFNEFLSSGLEEGRTPSPLFDPEYYDEQLKKRGFGVCDSSANRFLHWLTVGLPERILPTLLFDEEYYLAKNPDLKGAQMWAFEHYLRHGCFEKRDPHPDFNSRWYEGEYGPFSNGLPAYLYYLLQGFREGHRPSADFSHNLGVEYSDASLISPFEMVLKMERQDDIRERLGKGVLSEAIDRAQVIEPLLSKPRGYRRLSIHPFSTPLYPAVAKLRQSLKYSKYDSIVCIPHCRVGGASRVAGSLCNALLALFPDERLLLVRTDLSIFARQDWFPAELESVDLPSISAEVSDHLVQKILMDLFIGVTPKRVLNVNSRLCWDVFQSYGDRLSMWSSLYAYMFCYDIDVNGNKVGYPIEFFEPCFDNLTGLILDNSYLERYLSDRFHLSPKNRKKIVTLWSPVQMGKADDSEQDPGAKANDLRIRKKAKGKWRAFWAGRLDRQKRFDIVREIAERMPELEIWAWGHAILDAGYSIENLPDNMRFLGSFDHFEDLPLESCDFWLYTSGWDGLPTILIDVALAGIPTVASQVGGTSDLITDSTAWPVSNIDSVDAYVDVIERFMQHPEEVPSRVENMLKLASHQHNEHTYSKALSELLSSNEVIDV